MKHQQMKIEYNSHDHTTLDCRYTYCPQCGEYLYPKGWRMGGGNEMHSFYIEGGIDAKYIVGWDLAKPPSQPLPLLLNKMVVVALDNSFACFDIETAGPIWKTQPLGALLGLSSTPVLLRPFLFLAAERKLWKIKPFPQDNTLICDGELICEDERIQLANSIPVSMEKEGVKKAFFLFQRHVLICELKINRPDSTPNLTWIEFEDGLVPRSPVVLDDTLFFTSAEGIIYAVQENKLKRLISLGAGDFSAPMLYRAAGNSWLVVEGFNQGRHRLFAYNPGGKGDILSFALDYTIPRYDFERLWMWPIQIGNSHVAVSSYDCSGIHFISILSNDSRRENLPTPVRHWEALGSTTGIISVVDDRLQSISASTQGIRPLADRRFGGLRQPLYILANDTHFALIIGQNLSWGRVKQ